MRMGQSKMLAQLSGTKSQDRVVWKQEAKSAEVKKNYKSHDAAGQATHAR